MSQRRKPRAPARRTYSRLDEMMASPHQPLSAEWRQNELSHMWQGLRAIETAPAPTVDDWRVCSDAVNLMETLLRAGEERPDEHSVTRTNWWRDCAGDWVQIHDNYGLLEDAIEALTHADIQRLEGHPIRLDAAGILAVRAVLEDYRDLLDVLPARTMIRAHRLTEQRVSEINSGHKRPHDVIVIDLK